MDEESVGFFGVLLIITAIALTHPFHASHSMPAFPQMHWQDVVQAACGPDSAQDCSQTVDQ